MRRRLDYAIIRSLSREPRSPIVQLRQQAADPRDSDDRAAVRPRQPRICGQLLEPLLPAEGGDQPSRGRSHRCRNPAVRTMKITSRRFQQGRALTTNS